MSLLGVIICAVSVGIFKIAALGVDPFQSFMAGLDFGTLYVITNVVLLSFALITDRHYIGVATFYITADLGVSTYDAVALVLSNKYKIGKFKYIRIFTDIVCIIIGIALYLFGGGKIVEIPTFVGVGTIITAFFMGPLIECFNERFARPFLNGKN